MIAYIKGTVTKIGKSYIIVDNNGIGYNISFLRGSLLTLNQEVKIYTYQHFREDATVLYGFLQEEELDLFNKLISVKGLGPKTAQIMLSASKYSDLVNAIELGRIDYLKSMPSIGAKTAQQIILDLKGKLVESADNSIGNKYLAEAVEGLKAFGYKTNEINNVVKRLSKVVYNSSEEYLKEALKLLYSQKGAK